MKSFLLVLSTALVAGCSSSSSSPGTTGAGDGGGQNDSVCEKIAKADAQALLAGTITTSTDTTEKCVYGTGSGDPLPVEFVPADADKSTYNNLMGTPDQASDNPIAGIGDSAYWNEAVGDDATPILSAHKGDATCVIQPPDDPSALGIPYTGNASGAFKMTSADQLAYVQKMGKVCNDLFSSGG